MKNRMLIGLWLVILLTGASALAAAAPAPASSPTDVVKTFQDALLGVWRESNRLSPEQRYQRLEPPVDTAYDLKRMIEVATGSSWNHATEAERAALIKAFTRYSVATYASTFVDYGGQSFATKGERPGPQGRMVVETELVRPDDDPVSLDYVLRNDNGRWRIVDVVAKGVSELARRRSEYRATLKEGGPALLADRLNALADKQLKE